uniref:Uncharacterized protein n=1 Tax=Arundo donax TaxID=35708 RepID=A0A0A9FJH5_ARUDO
MGAKKKVLIFLVQGLGRCSSRRAQADARGHAHLLYAHAAAAPGGGGE